MNEIFLYFSPFYFGEHLLIKQNQISISQLFHFRIFVQHSWFHWKSFFFFLYFNKICKLYYWESVCSFELTILLSSFGDLNVCSMLLHIFQSFFLLIICRTVMIIIINATMSICFVSWVSILNFIIGVFAALYRWVGISESINPLEGSGKQAICS